jgi:UDP:flavonoid glycosyltransferase YjiC (YdhE family)
MLPFVYLGDALVRRGHDVALLGCEEYRSHVRDPRIRFHPIMSAEEHQASVARRKQAGGQAAPILDFFRWACSQIEPVYRLLVEAYAPGRTVVCAQSAAVGARAAQEKHGIPLATAHLQPLWMRSALDMPPIPPRLCRIVGPPLQALVDLFVDQTFRKDVARACRPLGVHPGRRMIRTWWNSPQCILGMFPEWYSPPQPDWPPQVVLTGFPVPTAMDPEFDATAIDAFLSSGDPPLVFSQGSNDPNAQSYFRASIEIAQTLGMRAVLLSPFRDAVPGELPDGVAWFPYVPLDVVLPRAALHVHHGGVGGIAQSLKAGIPQITVPSAFDQPDNSERLARLGVSRVVKPKSYAAARVATLVRGLMDSADVQARCREFAGRMAAADPFALACDALERLAEGRFKAPR